MAPPVSEKDFDGLSEKVVVIGTMASDNKKNIEIHTMQLSSLKKDTDDDRKDLNETRRVQESHVEPIKSYNNFRNKIVWLIVGISLASILNPFMEVLAALAKKSLGV